MAFPVGLITRTIKNGKVKLSRVNGFVGANYESCVNNKLKKQGEKGDFKAEPRKWGKQDGLFLTHNGNVYLPIKIESAKCLYTEQEPSEKKDELVTWRTYTLSNILEVTYKGKKLTADEFYNQVKDLGK